MMDDYEDEDNNEIETDICCGCGFEEQLIGDYCIECYFDRSE